MAGGGGDRGASGGAPVRRTQAERSAATRAALLDATIACLVELGYAETTIREVAVRAGVSRGAQAHHYPTKTDLVAAAIERMCRRESKRAAAAFRALPREDRTLDAAFRLLWTATQGPHYPALAEVVQAGRTDERLGRLVRDLARDLEDAMVALVATVSPPFTDAAAVRTAVNVAFAVVQGSAVSTWTGLTAPDAAPRLLAAATSVVTPEGAPLLPWLLEALEPGGPSTTAPAGAGSGHDLDAAPS